jgi:hypothetical protein
MSYTKAAQEGLRMAILCDSYPQVQVSKENFVNIQWAIDGPVDGLPEEGCSPTSSLIPAGLKGRPLWYVTTKRPGNGWVTMCHLWRNGIALGSKCLTWRFYLRIIE